MRLRDKVSELVLVSVLGAVSLAAHAISLIGREPKPMFNREDDTDPGDLFNEPNEEPVEANHSVPARLLNEPIGH